MLDGRVFVGTLDDLLIAIDAHTGKVLGKIDTPDAPNSHNLTVTADGKMAALASLTPVSAALAPKSSAAPGAVLAER